MTGPRGKTGKTGKTGATGATGPAGPAGADHTDAIVLLSDQVATLLRDLQTQLVRIGQIQVQLDALASGSNPTKRDRRATDRTER